MKFSFLAQAFAEIEPIQSRLEMTRLLAELLKKATPSEASIMCNVALGQLNPPYIGTQFNLAQKSAIKSVALLVGMESATVAKHVKQVGDIGSFVAQEQWDGDAEPTIHQIYEALSKLEHIGGAGSQEEKIEQLYLLLKSVDPISAKYLLRMVLGQLRLGFSDMTLVDALSWMSAGDKSLREPIEDAYNVCADLGLIAAQLKEKGIKAIEQMHVHVGIPIRPAAAERMPNARAIVDKMGTCVAQPKLDGFRLQIHIDHTKKPVHIAFFSRNLQDMSYMFPELTAACLELDVQTFIGEGEAIAYDPNTNTFLPFQETVKRKRKHGIQEMVTEYPLRAFLFDILYLDGQELLKEPHERRRSKLLKLFKTNKNDTLQVIQEQPIESAQELEHYFNENISAGLEGVVVKRPYAIYTPGKRNFNWIKLKRQEEEEGHLEDTIDCVILGYYAGSGKRAQFGIGAFLVGVFNEHEDRYETIAKIGTGLKDADWHDLKKKCDALHVAEKPKNVFCPKELVPDVWTVPEIVCMVRADEITLSPVHTAGKTEHALGFALRFPRFMGYRPDKSAREATTVDEIKHLFKDQK